MATQIDGYKKHRYYPIFICSSGGGWYKVTKVIIPAAVIGTQGRKKLVTKSRQVWDHDEIYIKGWSFHRSGNYQPDYATRPVYRTEYYQEWVPWED